MAAQLLLLDGTSLFVSEENGDVEANEPQGFFCNDVRHLSEWRLLIGGTPLQVLTSGAVDYFSGRRWSTESSTPGRAYRRSSVGSA